MGLIKALLLILLFTAAGIAQADYLTSVKVFVDGVALDKLKFKVDRLLLDGERERHDVWNVIRTTDANVVHLGLEERGTFAIDVSAEGFKPFEFKVFFAAGHMQTAVVKLARIGSSTDASVQRFTTVIGQVVDPTGAKITTAKAVFEGKKFGRFESTTTSNGVFEFSLPYDAFFRSGNTGKWEGNPYSPTRYALTVTAPGFQNFRIDDLIVTNLSRGSTKVDVVLGFQGP